MDTLIEDILDEIITDLGENYTENIDDVIENILNEAITNAFFISNRKLNTENLHILIPEIKSYVKSAYLLRGTEDTNSLSTSGRSSTFVKPIDKMRDDIIKNGKRVVNF